MTELIEQMSAIAVPLDPADRNTAHRFAAQQPTAEKSAQVYRNTLAVLATQRYLQTLGIETETEAAQSWHPLGRILADVADLSVPSLKGSLECRVMKAGDRTCHIPADVHRDRMGYVVIRLDEPYQVGYLVGFVKSVSVTALPLSYLQPLTALIEQFLDTTDVPAIALRQWLNHLFEPDWTPPAELLTAMGTTLARTTALVRQEDILRQRLENLYRQQLNEQASPSADSFADLPSDFPLAGQSDQDALLHLMRTTQNDNIRWQCADLLWEINPDHPECPVITAKDLSVYLTGHSLALAVGLLPKTDDTLLILARIYPFELAEYLPAGLKLIGFDETGESFFDIASRQKDNYIQFKFTANVGDRFALKVGLDGADFTETFVV
ncbi:MAG: DUF1822 family protein [Cyanobacteria bacterium J06598_1]